LPDLYDGEPVILSARIKGRELSPQGTALSLSGLVGGKPWQRKIELAAAAPVDGAGTLWGRARIADLMMSLHRGAEPESVRMAVTATALRHHIVSRYTSLVATEKAVHRPVDEPVFPRSAPRNLPDGWAFDKVFGGVLKTRASATMPIAASSAGPAQRARHVLRTKGSSAPVAIQGRAVHLPAGSTAAALNLIVGIVALLIGLILYRRKRAS
jgi:Ca-activated chloride channel family protein